MVRKPSFALILACVQRVLFAGAIVMLGYCGFVLADAWIFQHRELHQEISSKNGPAKGGPAASSERSIRPDGLIGRIEIARIGISVVVVEGTDEPTLRRSAGHILGTGLPGEPGNVGIAGHRDTFFRPLRNIQRNDIIILNTPRGEYRYRVVSTRVVSPYDIAVLDPDGNQILTLVTCYPFYFVGAAPNRFIVRAERVAG